MGAFAEPRDPAPGTDARVALITAPDLETARTLARDLVSSGTIACANLVPGVESIYRWRGAVEESREVLLVVKTTAARLAELESRVSELHPYEVPELVVLAPEHVAAPYLAWLAAETAPAPR
jgi:periplasmic divalent cation tolerance protein